MMYLGSKFRIRKKIIPVILEGREDGQWFVEPFCGGCNITSEVTGNRIANDKNFYLIKMWEKLREGWIPEEVDKELYKKIKNNKQDYPPELVAFAGFHNSFGSKWFGGFVKLKTNEEDPKNIHIRSRIAKLAALKNQINKMMDVKFSSGDYWDLEIPPNSIIYCDPPYQNTTANYNDDNQFDYDKFWEWCREKSRQGHKVYISEYNAPNDFKTILEIQHKTQINEMIKSPRLEKLFIWEGDKNDT